MSGGIRDRRQTWDSPASGQRAAYNAAWRADHALRGQCRECSQPAVPGRTRCAEHQARARLAERARHARWKVRRDGARAAVARNALKEIA